MHCMSCGCEVPEVILLQTYLYIQHLTERGHLQSAPLEQLCTYLSDAATVENIFGTFVVE